MLAQELASLDVLSEERLEIVIGAGWDRPEYDAIGVRFDPARVRQSRLAEAVTVLRGCLADGRLSFAGEHYAITDHDGHPKPVQRPHPPFFIGGGGRATDDLAGPLTERTGVAITGDELLDSPHASIESIDAPTAKFQRLRAERRISSNMVGEVDDLVPVVERLAGT
ncbi:MAG: LLM class flavin-dependent oxidoreductase [Acidimicrobiales bacterium]